MKKDPTIKVSINEQTIYAELNTWIPYLEKIIEPGAARGATQDLLRDALKKALREAIDNEIKTRIDTGEIKNIVDEFIAAYDFNGVLTRIIHSRTEHLIKKTFNHMNKDYDNDND